MAASSLALDQTVSTEPPEDEPRSEHGSTEHDENPATQHREESNSDSPTGLDRQFAAKSPGSREGGRNPWLLLGFLLLCGAGMYFTITSDGAKKNPSATEKPAAFESTKAHAKVVPGKEDEPLKESIADSQNFDTESPTPTREDLEQRKEVEERRKREEALRLARIKSAIIIAGGQGSFHAASANLVEPNGIQSNLSDGAFPVPRDTNFGKGLVEPAAESLETFPESNPPGRFLPTGDVSKIADRGSASANDPNERFFMEKSDRSRNVAGANRLRQLAYTVLQGKMIDCVLETAIQSDLPGQLRCSTSNDVYAESGRAVMLPAKTRLIGQYNSAVRKGQVRVFVIWQRAIAPNGIDIQLDSPGTDSLGRAGLGGEVDNHYLEIFGVSAMLSIIGTGASSYGVNSGDQPNSATAYRQAIQQSFAQTSQQVLSPYAQIAPTIHVNQGEAIKIFVNRDLDFTHVYASQPASTQPSAAVIR
jgi:type IV secretion system protein VirB10